MGKYDLIKNTIETIFHDLKIEFSIADFEDDDLNYVINFNAYGKLKPLKSIKGILYIHPADFSMNLIIANIYNLDDDNDNIDTLDIYEVLNDINSELLYGKFLIRDNKFVYYSSSVNCGIDFSGLNKELLQRQLSIFTEGLANLFRMLDDKERCDE